MQTIPLTDCVEGPSNKRVKKQPHPGVPRSRGLQPIARGKLRRIHKALIHALPVLGSRDALALRQFIDDGEEDVHNSRDASTFKEAYLRANVLKRFQGSELTDAEQRVSAAMEKLMETEIRCGYLNQVFGFEDSLERTNAYLSPWALTKLRRARRIIASILGPFPVERFPYYVDFTPGATSELPRKRARAHYKWELGTHVTPRALPYAMAFRRWTGFTDYPPFEVVDANVVFTVPKRFDRDRSACKPATWNGALQKAYGSMTRDRLQRKAKLLLPDSQEYHGLLAKIAARTGALVTHDSEACSDCVSVGLFAALWPPGWREVALDLREEYGVMPDGTKVRWEKLSTMGNGYTFEVETLLLYALVRSVCGNGALVSVYGDDVIYPVQYVDAVSELLLICGFSANRDKTFSSGPFRESCGSHYYKNVNVKPFYIEQLPRSLDDCINLHNDLVRWHALDSWGTPWLSVARAIREAVPRALWGPPGMVGTLWSEWDEATPVYVPTLQCFRVFGITRESDAADIGGTTGALRAAMWRGGSIGRREPLTVEEKYFTPLTGYYAASAPEKTWELKASTRCRITPRYVDKAQWKLMATFARESA